MLLVAYTYISSRLRRFSLSESWPSEEAGDIYKLVERMQPDPGQLRLDM